jgi:hypothetical protein
MAEMHGLAAIIANSGTIHSIAPEPQRKDYADETAYADAYRDWWRRMNLWRVETGGNTPDS